MKFLLASDLHTEFWKGKCPLPSLPNPDEYDVVILAGDIGIGTTGIEWALEYFPMDKEILYLAGNHEFYHQDYHQFRIDARKAVEGTRIKLLDPGVVEYDDCVVIGATLWSSLFLNGYPYQQDWQYERALSDFRVIKYEGKNFSAENMRTINKRETEFIVTSLGSEKKTIVVTHFLPSQDCIAPQYLGDNLNPYFCNDLDWIMEENKILDWIMEENKIDVWCSGHTHIPYDKTHKSGTRLVCNSYGYLGENKWPWDWKVIDV